MLRLLILVIAFSVCAWLILRLIRKIMAFANPRDSHIQSKAHTASHNNHNKDYEVDCELVSCEHCKEYVSTAEAIWQGGNPYCSKKCLPD